MFSVRPASWAAIRAAGCAECPGGACSDIITHRKWLARLGKAADWLLTEATVCIFVGVWGRNGVRASERRAKTPGLKYMLRILHVVMSKFNL